jgi:hypothetical protein
VSEYLEWREDGGPHVVRLHRRVVAGLESERAGDLRGLALGTVSDDGHELEIEDFAVLPPGGLQGAAHSLTPVGSFRVDAGAERGTDADLDRFRQDFPGGAGVLLLFQRSGNRVEWNDVVIIRPAAPPEQPAPALPEARRAARLDDTGERAVRRPRYFWPAVIAGSAALIIGAAYVTADRDARRSGRTAASDKARPPLADWKPVEAPAAPAVPPPVLPASTTPAANAADRSLDAGRALTAPDKAQVRQQIRDTLDEWSKSLLARNVEQYASLYAPTVGPYFRENRVSREQIAGEVRRMLGRYGALTSYRISDVTVAPIDENHAIANFRKEWRTAHDAFSGAEKAQLRFERQNGKWLITSEQELRVYWARKR